jgi:hypothetical protein
MIYKNHFRAKKQMKNSSIVLQLNLANIIYTAGNIHAEDLKNAEEFAQNLLLINKKIPVL